MMALKTLRMGVKGWKQVQGEKIHLVGVLDLHQHRDHEKKDDCKVKSEI